MFIDLTKTTLNGKIAINKELRDGDTVTFTKKGETFTFKDSPSLSNEIEIAKTEPIKASGSIKPYRNIEIKENEYININDLYGVFFSKYGSCGAFYLKSNVSTGNYIKITINNTEYTFIIGIGESTATSIFVNAGNTRAESAYFLSLAITNTLADTGIMAISYDEVVVIVKLSNLYSSNKNASAVVNFGRKANINDTLSFTYGIISYVYKFGNGENDVKIGNTINKCCLNLANKINAEPTKPVTAIAIDNKVYLYATRFGYNGNAYVEAASTTFSATDLRGGTDSDVTIDTDNTNTFGIQIINSCTENDNKLGSACVDALIHSLSDDLSTFYDEATFTSNIVYSSENSLPMMYYGRALEVDGIDKGLKSNVDSSATATNLVNALISKNITASSKNNVVNFELDSLEVLSFTGNGISTESFSNGSLENPMSWIELLSYKETINTRVNLDLVIIDGDLKTVNNPLTFNGNSNSVLTINTTKLIQYGESFPFIIENCNDFNIKINGRFISNGQNSGGLIKIDNCTSTKCQVVNCENTQVGSEVFLVKMTNCRMDSSLTVKNSTFTQSDTADNGSLMSIEGYVKIKSSYNVFDGKERATNYVFYLGNNCSLESSYDCYSKITPTDSNSVLFNNSVGINSSEPNCDDALVIDRSNENEWSLNLTPTSRALLISNSKEQIDDIYGHKRYLEKDYCKITITISDEVIGNEKFYNSNFIEINGVKKFFGSDLPYSYESKSEFANAVRDAFISSKCKIGIEQNGSVLVMYGTNETFNSNLGDYISINYAYEPNGTDAGSRQKHTVLNETYKVDLSLDDNTSEYLSLRGMEALMSSLFPCYGTVTFELKNSNDSSRYIRFGCDSNNDAYDGYCDFRFIGSKLGKNYVPTLKATMVFASKQALTFYFDGIFHIGSIIEERESNIEKTLIDVIFVNSILKWDNSAQVVSLRLIESTIVGVGNTEIRVDKDFIVNGCIIKCKLINYKQDIKALFRYNYVITNFEPTLNSLNKDTTESITGEDCLVNSSLDVIDGFAIKNNTNALSHITQISDLMDCYSSETDILGNYRCYESVKESLDCGAYETNITFGKSLNFVVNLDSDGTNNGGVYAPCSLKEVYEKINELDKIDIPIYIELNGYGTDLPKLEITKEFTDSGSIHFVGNQNTVLDGGLEDEVFVVNSDNATVSFANIMIRNCSIRGTYKKLVFSSCAIVNTENETLIDCEAECYFYGCSLQSVLGAICSSNSYVIGCSSQATNDISMFDNVLMSNGNVYYKGSITGGTSINLAIMRNATEAEIINNELFELINNSAKGLVTKSSFGDLYEDAENYNYIEDIRGFYRFEENENTDSGCYDSLGTTDASSYDNKPSGQYADITEEGSSLITRMLTGRLKFKIVGYRLGKGGYSKRNPLNAIPIEKNGRKTRYEVVLNTNNIDENDGIVIVGKEFRATIDFEIGNNIEKTIDNLIESVNKNNSCFYAEKVSNNTLSLTSMTISSTNNGAVDRIGTNFVNIVDTSGKDSNYGINLFYPNDGYKEFEYIDHIPFAISLFMRIERKQLQSALGEIIVYAKVIDSENLLEINSLVPFAVVRHGLITKDKDSVVVRRIIIQI